MTTNTGEEKIEKILRQISELKVVEAPDDEEFGRLPKGQIFMAGQMNVLMRIKMLADELEKEKSTGEEVIGWQASYALIDRGDGVRCAWCDKKVDEIGEAFINEHLEKHIGEEQR